MTASAKQELFGVQCSLGDIVDVAWTGQSKSFNVFVVHISDVGVHIAATVVADVLRCVCIVEPAHRLI